MGVEHFGGYHETVPFTDNRHVIVYLNDEPTSYPTHWHTPLEILMPVENGYTAHIGNRTFHLEPSDILFVAPNVYHAYAAPPAGKRIFVLIDMSAVSDVLGVRQMLSLINPTVLFTASNSPLTHARLRRMLRELCDVWFARDKLIIPPRDAPGTPADPVDLTEPVIYSRVMEMLALAAQNYGTSDRPAPVSRDRRQEYVNKMTMVPGQGLRHDECQQVPLLPSVPGVHKRVLLPLREPQAHPVRLSASGDPGHDGHGRGPCQRLLQHLLLHPHVQIHHGLHPPAVP